MKKHTLLSLLLISTTVAYASDAKIYPAPESTPTTSAASTFISFTSEIPGAVVNEIPLPYKPSLLVSNHNGLGATYSLHTSKELSDPFRLMLNQTTQQFYAVQEHSDSDFVSCREITEAGELSATAEERTLEYAKANLKARDNRTMYHRMDKALQLIKAEMAAHPSYDFYVTIEGQKYSLAINSSQYIIATGSPGFRTCYLARLFLIHWDRLEDKITFYATPSDPFSDDKSIRKTKELVAALTGRRSDS
ncbi:MAG: hypothetical protein QG604_864 [Candidatus Dependentiae bacterium]|nr:hypothetical protein [Candidatus Dependentiae bacterium]